MPPFFSVEISVYPEIKWRDGLIFLCFLLVLALGIWTLINSLSYSTVQFMELANLQYLTLVGEICLNPLTIFW